MEDNSVGFLTLLILMIAFTPSFHDCLCKLSAGLYIKPPLITMIKLNKENITRWLQDMNVIFPCYYDILHSLCSFVKY